MFHLWSSLLTLSHALLVATLTVSSNRLLDVHAIRVHHELCVFRERYVELPLQTLLNTFCSTIHGLWEAYD